MTKSPRVALSVALSPPPALSQTTQQRCHAVLRTRTLVAKPVPRWEWLVYATSVAICSGYLAQMTMTWGNDSAALAKIHALDAR